MDLNRSKWLDFSEKRLDKPRTVGYEFDLIQTVGKRLDKSKNGWINQKWLDMDLIRSKGSIRWIPDLSNHFPKLSNHLD